MRLSVYAHTLNLLMPRGWLAVVYVLLFLVVLFGIATNSRLEAHLTAFSSLTVMAAVFVGSMLLLIEKTPLSFCLPNQQRHLRPVMMLVGLGSCVGLSALTLKLMALNDNHALYTEFLAGPVFRLLLLHGLALYFLVLSLQLATTIIAVRASVAAVPSVLLLLSLLQYSDAGLIQSPAIAATGAVAGAALCWWMLGLRSVARHTCQGASSAQPALFQLNFWHGSAVESLLLAGIRRCGGDLWRGTAFESLYLALSGTTARNVLFALLASLYITVTLVLNFRETNAVRSYDFLVLPLIPLCFPIFRMETMLSPWLPVSRIQRFVRSLLQGGFHYLFALLLVLFVRATLSLLVWGFPDATWSVHAQGAVDMPLKIVFLCGLFALAANFFHVALPWTVASVVCVIFIGINCYDMARWLVPKFFALDFVDIIFVSMLTVGPFVVTCAWHTFRADLRERKRAWIA